MEQGAFSLINSQLFSKGDETPKFEDVCQRCDQSISQEISKIRQAVNDYILISKSYLESYGVVTQVVSQSPQGLVLEIMDGGLTELGRFISRMKNEFNIHFIMNGELLPRDAYEGIQGSYHNENHGNDTQLGLGTMNVVIPDAGFSFEKLASPENNVINHESAHALASLASEGMDILDGWIMPMSELKLSDVRDGRGVPLYAYGSGFVLDEIQAFSSTLVTANGHNLMQAFESSLTLLYAAKQIKESYLSESKEEELSYYTRDSLASLSQEQGLVLDFRNIVFPYSADKIQGRLVLQKGGYDDLVSRIRNKKVKLSEEMMQKLDKIIGVSHFFWSEQKIL